MKRLLSAIGCLIFLLTWVGCIRTVSKRAPLPPPPIPQAKHLDLEHLLGTWENLKHDGKERKLVFNDDGTLQFRGGMEFYNPGRWSLDSHRKELSMTFPQADVDKLQVFQLYVGDGLKAFHPSQKEIVYSFDENAGSLNVGGWIYSKDALPAFQPQAEPVLK